MWTRLLIAIMLVASFNARAATENKIFNKISDSCRNTDDTTIRNIVETMDRMDVLLPHIPPEEEKYLKAEDDALFPPLSTYAGTPRPQVNEKWRAERYTALIRRPLYPVWEFRKTMDTARASLQSIIESDPKEENLKRLGLTRYAKNPEADKLNKAIGASAYLARYTTALARVSTDLKIPNVFSADDQRSIGYWQASLPYTFSYYMKCMLERVTLHDAGSK